MVRLDRRSRTPRFEGSGPSVGGSFCRYTGLSCFGWPWRERWRQRRRLVVPRLLDMNPGRHGCAKRARMLLLGPTAVRAPRLGFGISFSGVLLGSFLIRGSALCVAFRDRSLNNLGLPHRLRLIAGQSWKVSANGGVSRGGPQEAVLSRPTLATPSGALSHPQSPPWGPQNHLCRVAPIRLHRVSCQNPCQAWRARYTAPFLAWLLGRAGAPCIARHGSAYSEGAEARGSDLQSRLKSAAEGVVTRGAELMPLGARLLTTTASRL